MSAWLSLLKAGLPYVAEIVADRLPAFTKNKEGAKDAADLTAQQIAELQQAVQRNAEAIKALAEQLQQRVKALEAGATEHERLIAELKEQIAGLEKERAEVAGLRETLHRRIEAARWTSLIAFGTAFLALCLAIFSNFV
nr:MAG: hypothetical protein DIU74_13120 [Pseudomonadota bacterium]